MFLGMRDLAGLVFSGLSVGDEIVIKSGCGNPQLAEGKTDIVVSVDGASALTASGIRLCCRDIGGISVTGKHFEVGEYQISADAQIILDAVECFQVITPGMKIIVQAGAGLPSLEEDQVLTVVEVSSQMGLHIETAEGVILLLNDYPKMTFGLYSG